jgi:hypothetical protein
MKIDQDGNELVIRVPLNVKPVASKSGKSRIVGSTSGFVKCNTSFGTVSVGVNAITTDEDYNRAGAPQPQPKLVKAS